MSICKNILIRQIRGKIILTKGKIWGVKFLVYFKKESEVQWKIPHETESLTGTSSWKEFI